MRVTLLALGARYIHVSPAPFYLASALLDSEHSVTVLDHSVNECVENVLSDIVKSEPDILGLSVYIWNLSFLKRLIPLVKTEMPHMHIVLGGPEVSYCAEQTLCTFPLIDAVLSGEGEWPFRQYCDAKAKGTSLSTVLGCSYRKDGEVHIAPPYVPKDGTPRSPLDSGYKEALKGRIAYIESSRGCPFSCAFCLSGRCGNVRFFDLDQVKREILLLAEESRTVKFVDRTFNADRHRAREIISFILAHYGKEIPKGTCFHFEMAGDLLEEETLKLLSSAPVGLFQTEIGVQSFHAPTLKAIRRSTDMERLTQNIRRLLENGNMHVHVDLIAGLPQESLRAFEESFNQAYALAPHMLQLGFLKLLHGAPLREQKEKYSCKYSAEPPYEVESTDVLSEEELGYIHVVEKGLDRVYNSGRYRRTLLLWSKQSKKSPFSLFHALGEKLSALPKGYTLNDEITSLYQALLEEGIEVAALRDAMLTDFLATNSSRFTPAVLRWEDGRCGAVKHALDKRFPISKGVRRAVILLRTKPSAVFVDYDQKHPVIGEYALHEVLLSDVLKLEIR